MSELSESDVGLDTEGTSPAIGGERGADRSLVADGGERGQGKAAPPEDILAAPANQLDTEPHPQAVTQDIIEMLDAAETLVTELDNPRDHGIDPSDGEVEQLTALANAVQDDEVTLTTGSAERSQGGDPVRELREGVRETRERHSVNASAALRLLEDLESARARHADQFATTLSETVEQLEQHQQLKDALGSLSPRQEPRRLGRELAREFDSVDGDHARRLSKVGRTLEATAEDLEDCRSEYRRLSESTEVICGTVATQTAWSADTNDPDEATTQLADALEDESVWFADETSSIAGFAASVDATDVAQSKPATEFLDVLRNASSIDDRRVRDAIREAVEAIDRTETVTTRLEGVDPDAVVRTADRLLSNLDANSSTIVPHLRERIEDIKGTAKRSNDADLLTLYAGRQELRYYDRTLIPQLSGSAEESTETDALAGRIDEVDDRRAEMRQSYPSEYPDCDHTIPIYFFDLASTLLEEARDLQTRGKPQQAAGVVDATEQLLDWIEGLYETHSYFVLLKELRG
jgi:hypothetical protein